MSQTLKLRFGATPLGGSALSQDVDITDESVQSWSFTVAGSTTDQQEVIPIVRARLKGIFLHSDQALTCETNNSTTPDDTLTILANKPLQWYTGMPGIAATDILGADVTTTYWTNAGSTTANVRVDLCVDASP